jgi:hypothetical protein
MMESRMKMTPAGSSELAIAGQPLSYFLAGSSDQTDVAAHRLAAHLASIRSLLARLEELVVPERLSVAAQLAKDMANFSAQVSLIGQVKAGKTKLTNALTGMPEMLPSDVNPWTSVVTSIHINTPKPRGSDAVFTFYTERDWAELTEDGGHLGKLAQRANFEAEQDEMRAQISAMRAKTEARLGANFSFLLGSQHQFRGFGPELLEKYVCLGEDGDIVQASGRYADVTKSADLYIDSPDYILPTTISDTPGVNDPFLARERATLATLGKTDICVIVLSANQAFSTVDLALMRVLMAMKAEQIILFVNRVDELENPDLQIPEIDAFIRSVLQSKGIRTRVPIVYGSAVWAELAMRGEQSTITRTALQRLMLLADARVVRAGRTGTGDKLHLGQPPYSTDKVRDLSGLSELKNLIAHKSVMNIGAPFAADVLVRATDVASQSVMLLSTTLDGDLQIKPNLDMSAMIARMKRLLNGLEVDFPQLAAAITERMLIKMSTAFREFIDSESARLRETLQDGTRLTTWSPDTDQLRTELNNAYHAFATEMSNDIGALYDRTAQSINAIYADLLDGQSQLFSVQPPNLSEPKTPPTLMRTMSFDVKTSWIGSWLAKATGPATMLKRLNDLVTAEMVNFLDELRNEHVSEYVHQSRQTLHDFLVDHLETLQKLSSVEGAARGNQARQKLGIEIEVKKRLVSLKGLLSELQAQTEAVVADFRLKRK